MGRHGGGSRSGGSRGRSGGGSSSSGGSGHTTSTRPFRGAYNRSYYHNGRLYECYTTDANFGTRSGWNPVMIFVILFVIGHMVLMLSGMLSSIVIYGTKLDGDKSFIKIEDTANVLSEEEEQRILRKFNEVYDKSGMPIMLYTSDYEYKLNYNSIEAFSEEIYYKRTLDEDCMVILITFDTRPDFMDWNYDMYCGDDTINCFSDSEFDVVLSRFQKAMYQMDIPYAVEYAWDAVMDDIGKTNIDKSGIMIIPFLMLIYGTFIFVIFSSIRKQNIAYKYFKEHPEKLSNRRCDAEDLAEARKESVRNEEAHVVKCKNCGVDNLSTDKTCRFCGKDI